MSLMHRILKGLFLAVVGIVVLASPFIVLYFAFAGLRPGSTMSPEVLAAYVAEIVWAAAQVLSLFAIAFSAAVAISSHGAWTGAVQAVQRRPMDFGDYYSLLGVRRGATVDEIREAYRRLVKRYHPDVSSHPMAEEIMKAVNEAKNTLMDPVKRKRYDEMLASKSAYRAPTEWGHVPSGMRGKLVCKVFSAIPTLMIALLLIHSLTLLPSVLRDLSFGHLFSMQGLVDIVVPISLFFLTVLVISGSVFYIFGRWVVSILVLLVAFTILLLIPALLYVSKNPSPQAYSGLNLLIMIVLSPSLPLLGSAYLTMRLIIETLRQVNLAYLLVSMSMLAAVAVWYDKRQAVMNCWRVPEAALKRIAIVGGGLAMLLTCIILRHKIRKVGFILALVTAVIVNIATMWLVIR